MKIGDFRSKERIRIIFPLIEAYDEEGDKDFSEWPICPQNVSASAM